MRRVPKKMRNGTLSLNEKVRTKERDDQEAKRKAREALESGGVAKTDPAAKSSAEPLENKGKSAASKVVIAVEKPVVSTEGENDAASSVSGEDDGLQADERAISKDLAREVERKAKRDIVLNEAAQILSDEIDLIHHDTKLAARVLPHEAAANVD